MIIQSKKFKWTKPFRWLVLGMLLVIIAVFLPFSLAHASDNGVDDLRGRWDVEWVLDGDEENSQPPLILYINDLVEIPYMPDKVFAGGCMRSPETGAFMPLSLSAVPDQENGTYDVSIYSTIIPDEGEPYVILLIGTITVHGEGVTDDEVGGTFRTEESKGDWSGIHHDRRRTKCPSVGYGQFVQADVRLQQDLAFDPPASAMVLELYTPVVSSAMQVELPDGSIRIIEHYTDIFSPDVDFVGRFRYFEHFEGEHPVVGEPYKFTLLDVFGNPIPGTESTDVFSRCTLDAPMNVSADGTYGYDVELTWDAVDVVDGEFYPALQGLDSDFHPPYQIGIGPANGDLSGEFGALGFSNSHRVPWVSFEPGGNGYPDGFDFGQPLTEFDPGLYQIVLDSWNMPVVDQGGYYQDCAVYDSSETLFMEKFGDQLSFTASGTISGIVTLSGGDPISNVWVDACEFDNENNPFCRSGLTNENGEYRITGLFQGDYRIQTGGGNWTYEFFDDKFYWDEATRVGVNPGTETPNINFELEPAGSISGTVFDFDGIPLGGIAVDTESGGYGTCTDEYGNYTLEGLPLGTFNIVAGRDFCEPHPYTESTIVGIELTPAIPNVSGVNFTLEIYVEPSPQYLNVQPDHMWADSGGWAEGVEVTLSFGEHSPNEFASVEGNVWFDLTETDIAPGVNVNITDGVDSKYLLIVSVSFDGADDVENTAWGTAPKDAWLGVAVVDENGYEDGFHWVDGIQADENGNWFVDFDDYGQDFATVIDAWVHVFDDDGDSTLAHLEIPGP